MDQLSVLPSFKKSGNLGREWTRAKLWDLFSFFFCGGGVGGGHEDENKRSCSTPLHPKQSH